jgi:Protein of unknown function (DUF1573)
MNNVVETIQANLDLGDVKVGEDRFFEVSVRNTSPQAHIVTTTMSCGSCTDFVSGPDFVASGAEGKFKFRFNPTATGPQIKSIFFHAAGEMQATFVFKAIGV